MGRCLGTDDGGGRTKGTSADSTRDTEEGERVRSCDLDLALAAERIADLIAAEELCARILWLFFSTLAGVVYKSISWACILPQLLWLHLHPAELSSVRYYSISLFAPYFTLFSNHLPCVLAFASFNKSDSMSFFFGGFDKQRYSAHLRMVVERLRIAQNKRQNEIKIERRELSVMLATRKFDKARIKVESVLRKTREGEASEVLALMVDLLIERVPLVASEKTCPADLIESVATVLWAAPRAGVEELKVVRDQLVHKYTDKWAAAVTAGPEMRVNGKVFTRLTVRA